MPRGTSKARNKLQKLLVWVGNSGKESGAAYEEIRTRLIMIFCARGCRCSEELADETIDRVTNKIDTLIINYEGDPRLYFYGVAKNVFREHLREPVMKELPPNLTQSPNGNSEKLRQNVRKLTKCLAQLPDAERRFILDYYKGDSSKRIKNRQKLKQKLGITPQAMRVRAFRIRAKLQESFRMRRYENAS